MRITCAIICYNYGRFLAEAIESCINQEPGDYEKEILVIDDGSTDNTPEVCRNYEGQVRVSRTENRGFGASLTRAVEESQGDFICLMDADDSFSPGKLLRLSQVFVSGHRFVSHDMVLIDENSEISGFGIGGNTSTIAFSRKEALDLLPVQNEAEFHLIAFAGWGIHLGERLANYRIHPTSMTDRSVNSTYSRYFSKVKLRTAAKARDLLGRDVGWIKDRKLLERKARHLEALGAIEECEACVNEMSFATAVKSAVLMVVACVAQRSCDVKAPRVLARLVKRTVTGFFWK